MYKPNPVIAGGQMRFKYLTKELPEKTYEVMKIKCWLKMLNDNAKPKKWLKPTTTGTKVNYLIIQNNEEYHKELDTLEAHITEINSKFGTDITLNRPK